jgi:hypothetical protein
MVYRLGKQEQKPDPLTSILGDIPLKVGGRKPQQIRQKTENLEKKIQNGLVVACAEVVSLDNNLVSSEKRWNGVRNVCHQCPYDSSEGQGNNKPLEPLEIQVQPIDEDTLKWIQEHHSSPVAGHPGQATTYNLFSRNYGWEGMCKDVDHYVCNCPTSQRCKGPHGKTHCLYNLLEYQNSPGGI